MNKTQFFTTEYKRIFLVSFYFLLILFLGMLIGQKHINPQVPRIILSIFIFVCISLSLKLFFAEKMSIKFDGAFLALITFSIYSIIAGYFQCGCIVPVLHAAGLLFIFLIMYLCIIPLSQKSIFILIKSVGCITILYTLANIFFFIFFPARVFNGGYFNFHHHAHPYIGLLFNPNGSADVLFINIVMTSLAMIVSQKKFSRIIFFLNAVLLIGFLMITGSRSTIGPLMILIGLLATVCFLKFKKDKCSFLIYIVLLELAVLLIAFILQPKIAMLFHANIGIHHLENPSMVSSHAMSFSLSGRNIIWNDIFNYMIQGKRYLFGIGLGRQEIVLAANGLPFQKSHNTFIDIFVGTGIFGLLLFIGFIGVIYKQIIKNLRANFDLLSFFLFASVSVVILHSMFESYLINQLSPDYFCFLLCYFLARKRLKLTSQNNAEFK